MNLRVRPLLVGMATFIPGVKNLTSRRTGGTDSARYCYSVWLRHLVMARAHGLGTEPKVVAELGPGDSLGIGIAALLTGSEKYYGFDVVRYAETPRNLAIFDELVALFRDREPIPDATEFPLIKPYLDSYAFPTGIIPDGRLDAALAPDRLEAIRAAISALDEEHAGGGRVAYFAPEYDLAVVPDGTVDMIFSQTVMEYPQDLAGTYRELCRWLRPGGYMSHDIDFKCLGTARNWNGHWAYTDLEWNAICGNRRYRLSNRESHSTHIRILNELGMDVVCDECTRDYTGIKREQLFKRFHYLTDDDLTLTTAFVQAVKPIPAA